MVPQCRSCGREMTFVDETMRRKRGEGQIADAEKKVYQVGYFKCFNHDCGGGGGGPMRLEHWATQVALTNFGGDVTVKCRNKPCKGAHYTVQRVTTEEAVTVNDNDTKIKYFIDNVMVLSPKLQPSQQVTILVEVLATHTDAEKLTRLSEHYGAENVCEVKVSPVKRRDGDDDSVLLERLKRGLRHEIMQSSDYAEFCIKKYHCDVDDFSKIDWNKPHQTKYDALMVDCFRQGYDDGYGGCFGKFMVWAHAVGGEILAQQEHPKLTRETCDFLTPQTIARARFGVVRRTEQELEDTPYGEVIESGEYTIDTTSIELTSQSERCKACELQSSRRRQQITTDNLQREKEKTEALQQERQVNAKQAESRAQASAAATRKSRQNKKQKICGRCSSCNEPVEQDMLVRLSTPPWEHSVEWTCKSCEINCRDCFKAIKQAKYAGKCYECNS
jgi:hypothetical protein